MQMPGLKVERQIAAYYVKTDAGETIGVPLDNRREALDGWGRGETIEIDFGYTENIVPFPDKNILDDRNFFNEFTADI